MKNEYCFATIIGFIGSFFSQLFGGWSTELGTLIIFMVIDFILGICVAAFFHNSDKSNTGALSSGAGFKGLCKKCATLLMILVGYRIDLTLGTDYVKSTCIIAFIVVELISIIENLGLMSVPIPQIIMKSIDILKQKSAEDNNKDGDNNVNPKN